MWARQGLHVLHKLFFTTCLRSSRSAVTLGSNHRLSANSQVPAELHTNKISGSNNKTISLKDKGKTIYLIRHCIRTRPRRSPFFSKYLFNAGPEIPCLRLPRISNAERRNQNIIRRNKASEHHQEPVAFAVTVVLDPNHL